MECRHLGKHTLPRGWAFRNSGVLLLTPKVKVRSSSSGTSSANAATNSTLMALPLLPRSLSCSIALRSNPSQSIRSAAMHKGESTQPAVPGGRLCIGSLRTCNT